MTFIDLLGNAYFNGMNRVVFTDLFGLNKISQDMDKEGDLISNLFSETPSEWTFRITAYPFDLTNHIEVIKNKIVIGDYETGADGYYGVDSFLIATNLYYGELGTTPKFYNYEDYSSVEIFLPYCGYAKLDITNIINKFIHVFLSIDYGSGYGTYTIATTNSPSTYPTPKIITSSIDLTDYTIVTQQVVKIGIEIPITYTNSADTSRNLISTIFSIATPLKILSATSNPMLSGAMLATTAMNSSGLFKAKTESRITRAETRNVGSSNFSGITDQSVYLRITEATPTIYEGTEEYNIYLHENGAPLEKCYSNLRSFVGTGYTELSQFHIEGAGFSEATDEEIEELNRLLSNGIIL